MKSLTLASPRTLIVGACALALLALAATPERSRSDAGCPFSPLSQARTGEQSKQVSVSQGAEAVQLCRFHQDGERFTLGGSFHSEAPQAIASLRRAFNRLPARSPRLAPCAKSGGWIEVFFTYPRRVDSLLVIFGGCGAVFDYPGASVLTPQLTARLVGLTRAPG